MSEHSGRERLLSEREVADWLHVGYSTAKKRRAAGGDDWPPHLVVAGTIRYDPEAVRRWLDEQGKRRGD
jgi:hypothetical protein